MCFCFWLIALKTGYYEDTASTLEKYLKLHPADEVATVS